MAAVQTPSKGRHAGTGRRVQTTADLLEPIGNIRLSRGGKRTLEEPRTAA